MAAATVAALQASGAFVGVVNAGGGVVQIDLGCAAQSTPLTREITLSSGQEYVATEAQRQTVMAAEGLAPDRVIVQAGLAVGNVVAGSLHGLKFEDRNGNGQRDWDEWGLAQWTFTLTGTDGLGRLVQRTAVTMSDIAATAEDESGWFSFSDVWPGIYTVAEVSQAGWVLGRPLPTLIVTSGHELVALMGQAKLPDGSPKSEIVMGDRLMLGNYRLGEIHGEKFEDVNGNGLRDPGDRFIWASRGSQACGSTPIEISTACTTPRPNLPP